MPAYEASVPYTRSSSLGMPARLVDLHVQLRRVEDDRPPAGRALGRGQERDRLLRVLLGMTEQVEASGRTRSRPPASRRRCRASSVAGARRRRSAFASMPEPTWVIVCSVKLPSLAANVFHSRWAAYGDSV